MKLLVAALLVLAAPLGAQTVHVVDVAGGPGSSFTSVNAAIAAAADDDVILVRTGEYPEVVTLVGKSLTLLGDPESGPAPEVDALVITHTAPFDAVTVRGIHLKTPTVAVSDGILLRSNVGPVWIEELSMPDLYGVSGNGFLVEDCSSVVLNDCRIGAFFRLNTQPAPVLFVRSSVHVFDTQFAVPFVHQTNGPAGIRAEGPGVLGVYESTITGADGVIVSTGHGTCYVTDGGASIHLEGDVELFVQDSILQGGQSPLSCTVPIGQQVPAVHSGTGAEHMLTSTARTHRATSAVRDDGTIDVTLEGEPGDRVRVFFSLRGPMRHLNLAVLDGPILLFSPLMKVSHGMLPASGTRSLSLPVGDLGPGVDAIVIYTQALFIGGSSGSGELVLSEPTAVTLLDESY